MKRLILVFVLVVTMLFVSAARLAPGEYVFDANEGIYLSEGYYTAGPGSIDLLADGTATVVFFWFELDDRTTSVMIRPVADQDQGDGGESGYNLRANIPRTFDLESWGGVSDGPDSMGVTLGTATEVIATW